MLDPGRKQGRERGNTVCGRLGPGLKVTTGAGLPGTGTGHGGSPSDVVPAHQHNPEPLRGDAGAAPIEVAARAAAALRGRSRELDPEAERDVGGRGVAMGSGAP